MARPIPLRKRFNCTQNDLSKLLKTDRSYVAHLESYTRFLSGNALLVKHTTEDILRRKENLPMSSLPLHRRTQQGRISLKPVIENMLRGYRIKQMRNTRTLEKMKARESACTSAIHDLGWLLGHPEHFDEHNVAVFDHMLKSNLATLNQCDQMAQLIHEVRLAASTAAVQKLEELLAGMNPPVPEH